ncbi:DMT family transporter [Heyndrickxia camelliae]|uniref:EamA family transporter n=1 Tax=Heyndrickxia camelliae TaxID=1707093 RepID=A0A2N3LLN0_9BACI|nr:DMT family transporter [Heyndrickxia camelliae]PKR85562.1 EamA family transporter [Heyndrickxia camelliae]
MWILAALTTSIGFGVNNTIFKWSSTKHLSKVQIQFFFYFMAFLLTFCYGSVSNSFHPSVLSIFLGSFIGILNANGNIQMSRAFEKGPASLTSPIIAVNTIIPILCAALIFKEQIHLMQWIGIICMLCAVFVIQYTPKYHSNTNYVAWMFRVLLSILSFGILGILMKTTTYLHIHSLDILVSMYGGGSLYLGIHMLIVKEKIAFPEIKTGIIIGIISVIGYSCYFYALNKGLGSIVFPIVSLNCLVVVLAGCYIYKESLKSYQIVGVIVALVGIVLTKI